MKLMPTDYWAKFSSSGDEVEWLPLEDHLVDVAACFETLLKYGYGKPLAVLNKVDTLTKSQIARLCSLALIHDIGKAIKDFQRQIFESENKNRTHLGHTDVSCSMFVMAPENGIREKFMTLFPSFRKWFEYKDEEGENCFASMLLSSWGHHGKPVGFDFENRPNEDDLSKVSWGSWAYLNFAKLIDRLQKIISTHWPELAQEDTDPLLASGPLMAEFNGILTLADWMASDDRYFTYDHGCGSRYDFAIETAETMMKKSGRGKVMSETNFENIFGFKQNAIQSCFENTNARLYA